MNRWAIVAIPLVLCLVLMEAVVRQLVADLAFRQAKGYIAQYERLYANQEKERPVPTVLLGRRLRKAVKLEPRSPEYRNYLGRYYHLLASDPSLSDERRMKLVRQAIRQYERAVKLEPLNGMYLARLAWMQGMTGKHEQAVDNFEKAMRLDRSNEWIQRVYEAYRKQIITVEPRTEPQESGGS